jgi:hypothetical protein
MGWGEQKALEFLKSAGFANAQPEPVNLSELKSEILKRWPMTSLLDMLKETDLRTDFSKAFKSATGRESLDPTTLQKRLLLCLYGLGTNTPD